MSLFAIRGVARQARAILWAAGAGSSKERIRAERSTICCISGIS